MKYARFMIVSKTKESTTIRDLGPWDQFPTITNDAESVVEFLVHAGDLEIGQRLFYIDSEGAQDEILIDASGSFAGFAPGGAP